MHMLMTGSLFCFFRLWLTSSSRGTWRATRRTWSGTSGPFASSSACWINQRSVSSTEQAKQTCVHISKFLDFTFPSQVRLCWAVCCWRWSEPSTAIAERCWGRKPSQAQDSQAISWPGYSHGLQSKCLHAKPDKIATAIFIYTESFLCLFLQ